MKRQLNVIEDFLNQVRIYGLSMAARKSGVSFGTIAGWIYEGRAPRFDLVIRLADAIGMEFLLFDKLEGDK